LDDKAKQARNEYMKQYRKKNPERIKKIQEKYWEKKAAIAVNS
jgi:hypothetical protein